MKFTKLATTAAAVLLSGSVFASNMGFKLVYPLLAPAGGNQGANWVSIPYFNSFATQNAAGVWADLDPACRVRVSRYNAANDTFQNYSGGGIGQTNFTVASGEAYLVKVSTNCNWTIVGSHDNALALSLLAPVGGNQGANWVSVPYHTTDTNAAAIWAEMPASKVRISRYNPVNDTFQNYSGGGIGQTNFTVTIGEAYLAKVSADATWTPAHY